MNKQIRIGTFETNSSSTHSLIMCTEEEYKKLLKKDLIIDFYEDTLVKNTGQIDGEENDNEDQFKTLDQFFEDSECETFNQKFTTPSGETVVAFGYYGYDS